MSQYLNLSDFALVPGPQSLDEEPVWSFDCSELAIYAPQEVADAVLAVPGIRLLHSAEPSWDQWRARWEKKERWIEFSIGETQAEPAGSPGPVAVWGGSELDAHCQLEDILSVWKAIRTRLPCAWLHDSECRLWSPESLAHEYGD